MSRKPRREFDFYPTDHRTIRVALMAVSRDRFEPTRILDPGSGDGRWGAWARKRWPSAHITGVEIREVPAHPSCDDWVSGCFLTIPVPLPSYDLVIGGPPYCHAEEFIRRGLDLLCDGGRLIFLLTTAFGGGLKRGRGLWVETPLRWVNSCTRRPSFSEDGKPHHMPHSLYTWQKGWRGEATWDTTMEWEEAISRRGRPRIYATKADRQDAYRKRKERG